MSKKRLLSGIQPTGRMHLGNYLGAVQNWVQAQESYDAFFMIADFHALTSVYENPSALREAKYNLVIDLLAVGIDPSKAALFFQSDVSEHAVLHLLLSMITPLPWLERVPTYKGKMDESSDKDLHTYGFLGYPVLQAADILLYKADVVPVGKDQLPHLELTREIGRRFNHFYGSVFPEPQELLTHYPVLPGLDGRKMSKSYNNTISLGEDDEQTHQKVMKMVTDPARVKRTDPGHPEQCPVFEFHRIFNTPTRCLEIDVACKTAAIGCVECKKDCSATLIKTLKPSREKRQLWLENRVDVEDILHQGTVKAKDVAKKTIDEVRQAVGL